MLILLNRELLTRLRALLERETGYRPTFYVNPWLGFRNYHARQALVHFC